MIRHLAATAAATALLLTTIPAAAATTIAAPQQDCVRTVLDLPKDSLAGSSRATSADFSGRYILGEANREGRQHSQALLWVDGVPRWLDPKRDGENSAHAVIKGGLVLGSTSTSEDTYHWIYDPNSDTYKVLDAPKDLQYPFLAGMNERQDIIGYAWDGEQSRRVPFVWPAGGQARLLPEPEGFHYVWLDDIGDDGRIVGRFEATDGSVNDTSFVYESWDNPPLRLDGLEQKTVWARDIEGRWIAGGETDGSDVTGLIWDNLSGKIEELQEGVVDLNSSKDAVTAGSWGPGRPEVSSLVIRSDGTTFSFPYRTMLSHVFERGQTYTAAGYNVVDDTLEPVLYSCGT